MKEPFLDEYEKRRYEMCLRNIEDKLKALKAEAEKEKPYRGYIKEKVDSILWDAKCIDNMTNRTEEDE